MNRLDNLDFIIRYLLDERGEAYRLPSTLVDKQKLMRGLLNMRAPGPVSDDFLKAQDAELQMQRAEKGVVGLDEIASQNRSLQGPDASLRSEKELLQEGSIRLLLWQGDITRLQVDAVVNAANAQMLGCFVPLHACIDNAIHSAAGVQLRLECDMLMKEQGCDERTGDAKITKGYNLPAKYVIHTVGPVVPDGRPTEQQEAQLASCYRSCLLLAEEYGLESIAFCCISTGVFRFPNERAAEIAVQTVRDFSPKTIHTVVFNVFKNADDDIYRKLL
ncbi:MAG: protein-ADP-ribose hydrolase [Prevotella sp.]|nr:protein-ADP-ribose hydrolase [Prevotella sp.]